MKVAMSFLYASALLFVVVQWLFNSRQVEWHEQQLMLNARLLEVNFDLVKRIKALEVANGIEQPPGKLKALPEGAVLMPLPLQGIGDPRDEPGFSWMFPKPCQAR